MKFSLIFLLLLNSLNIKIDNNYHNINNNNFNYFKKISLDNYTSSSLYKVSDNGNIIWFVDLNNNLYQQNLILNKIISINLINNDSIEQLKISDDGSVAWVYTYNKNLYFINNQYKTLLIQNNLNDSNFVLSNNGNKCWYIDNGLLKNFDSVNNKQNLISKINDVNKIQVSDSGNIIWFLDNNSILEQYNLNDNKIINYKINNIVDLQISLDGKTALAYDINNKIYKIINGEIKFSNLSNLDNIIENFQINDIASEIYFYYSDSTIYKLDNDMNLIKIQLNQKVINYKLTKENNYLWIYTNESTNICLYVVDNFQNIHKLSFNLSYENSNIEFSKDGRKIFLIDQNYFLYELNFEIIELLNLNNDYVYKDNFYYYSNDQIMYLNNNYLTKVIINNQTVDLNKLYSINKISSINLKLNSNLSQYNFLFSNDINNDQTVNIDVDIDKGINEDDILYNSKNNLIIHLGQGASNSNISNCKVLGVYLNNANNLDIDFNFTNIKLLDYSNSFLLKGNIDVNKNFYSNNSKQYINNTTLTLTNTGIYELFLSDLLGNNYIEYIELGNVDNQFNFNWQNNDFNQKLNKFNINISNEIANEPIDKKNIDYNKIYDWLNSYEIYFNLQFTKLFNNEITNFNSKTGFNLSDKFSYYLNNIWNEINKFSISTIIKTNDLDKLSSYDPKINFDKIQIFLENSLSNDIKYIINSKINSVMNVANSENILVKNILCSNDLDNYINYVNNYNAYLNQNFELLVQDDLTKLNISNLKLRNNIINNRISYLNLVQWNSSIPQKNFLQNINNQKIINTINEFKYNLKKHIHKIQIIIFSTFITIIILVFSIIIIVYRNKTYIKMKFSKTGRRKLNINKKNRNK